MTQHYSAIDQEHHGGSFTMGLMTGAILGAGLAMLFAPKRGSELRSQLSETANAVAANATDTYRRAAGTASEWMERGREAGGQAYEKARAAVDKGTREAQRYVREATDEAEPYVARSTAAQSTFYEDTARDDSREH
jgi:gas vesicle protein